MHRAFCFHFTAARQGSSMASVPVFCRDFWAGRKKAPGGAGRFGMRAACALRIFSGRIIFISRLSRSAERSKRIFTGGVVAANGICSAAFCESAALRAGARSPMGELSRSD